MENLIGVLLVVAVRRLIRLQSRRTLVLLDADHSYFFISFYREVYEALNYFSTNGTRPAIA